MDMTESGCASRETFAAVEDDDQIGQTSEQQRYGLREHRVCLGTTFNDISGQLVERWRQQPFVGQRPASFFDQRHSALNRSIHAQEGGISALMQRNVATSRLPQLIRGRRDVQDIVGDLERETDGGAVLG
jgi:hypothetical protein